DFCSACGGALWSRHPDDPGLISVRMGAFDTDPGIRPSARQYVDYAAPWEPIPDDGLPRYPERRTA
ncbi:MAG TPA: GFA family protein, partial [Gaiellaceae bacterium]|nr:GFA family protein [Gaiellaceae bacterium]